MSVEIYYFSGTGNSLHIAKELQQRIPETTLIPLISLLNKPGIETKAEMVGFVFPTYCHTVPVFVKNFIKKLELTSARYIFAVATTFTTQCRAFIEIDKILHPQGKRLDAYFVLKMPHNMPFYVEYDHFTTAEKIARMESDAQSRLESITNMIVNQEQHRVIDPQFTRPIPAFLLPLMPVLIPMNRYIVKSFTKFYADSNCSGCGTCEKVCLSGKIKVFNQKPLWQKKVACFQCQACINYCPAHSIQQHSTWFMKSYSAKNGRHHDPEISAGDIAGQKGVHYE